MKHDDRKIGVYQYHGKLLEDTELKFDNQSVTLEKNIEFVIIVVGEADIKDATP